MQDESEFNQMFARHLDECLQKYCPKPTHTKHSPRSLKYQVESWTFSKCREKAEDYYTALKISERTKDSHNTIIADLSSYIMAIDSNVRAPPQPSHVPLKMHISARDITARLLVFNDFLIRNYQPVQTEMPKPTKNPTSPNVSLFWFNVNVTYETQLENRYKAYIGQDEIKTLFRQIPRMRRKLSMLCN